MVGDQNRNNSQRRALPRSFCGAILRRQGVPVPGDSIGQLEYGRSVVVGAEFGGLGYPEPVLCVICTIFKKLKNHCF